MDDYYGEEDEYGMDYYEEEDPDEYDPRLA